MYQKSIENAVRELIAAKDITLDLDKKIITFRIGHFTYDLPYQLEDDEDEVNINSAQIVMNSIREIERRISQYLDQPKTYALDLDDSKEAMIAARVRQSVERLIDLD